MPSSWPNRCSKNSAKCPERRAVFCRYEPKQRVTTGRNNEVEHMADIRKGMPGVQLTREEFARRFRERFYDPVFEPLGDSVDRITNAAWDAYDKYRKAPRTRKAGPGYADPDYDLSVEWIEASQK